ncbi:MAG: hypothetical protein P4L84_00940 [Isosphaeraceae bacterium]|nr:hypothetical protein [Isosphaeraceae bacterium]
MNDGGATWVGLTGPWAMLGLREIVIVGMVALALYGRTGLRHTHHARTVWSWMLPRRPSRPAPRPPRTEPRSFWALANWASSERLFWALALVAAVAVAAWIITRTLIVSAPVSAR